MVRAYETARVFGDGLITIDHVEIALIIGGFSRERAVELLDLQEEVANKLFERVLENAADESLKVGVLRYDTVIAEFLFEHGDVEDIHGMLEHFPETKLLKSISTESGWMR